MENVTPIESEIANAEPVYEAPRIETVLTAEELEREVLYAGGLGGSL